MPTKTVETFSPVELSALRSDLTVIIPCTVASGAGVVAKGAAMGIVTASGKAKPYSNTASDGTETCVGFLNEAVDATNEDVPSGLIIGGYLIKSKLSGLDAAAEADLRGVNFPTGIFKF